MKRQTVGLGAFLILCFLYPQASAHAQNPHFVYCSPHIGSGYQADDLIVSWKEAGLGNNENVDYTTSADATAQYGCINGGGHHPKATNKQVVNGPVSAEGTFNSGRNGSISADLVLQPPDAGDFSCPSGQILVLLCGTYTDVQLTDTTNDISCDEGLAAERFTFRDPQFGKFCTLR
jgi:hypothetical protein